MSPMRTPRLLLVPAPLDFGLATDTPLDDLLPRSTLRAAASLSHWVVENAKTARAKKGKVADLGFKPNQVTRVE